MRTLTRSASREQAAGKAIPLGVRALTDLEISIRSSEVTMFAGIPGAGKSSIALYLAMLSKVPTLYVCADTSLWTMRIRALSMVTGLSFKIAEAKAIADPDWANEAINSKASHISWADESAPTLNDLDAELQAYEEVMGCPPELIVVDNLSDVSDGDDEWGSLRRTLKELKFLARDTGAAVLLLHHVTDAATYSVCPPRSTIQGKVSAIPAVIVTLHHEENAGMMGLAAVKNRFGKADPSGQSAQWLWFNAATMTFSDVEDK